MAVEKERMQDLDVMFLSKVQWEKTQSAQSKWRKMQQWQNVIFQRKIFFYARANVLSLLALRYPRTFAADTDNWLTANGQISDR